jgi:peptidoglycan hydrolase-like protein with peptidoglycan-binding domain
MDRRTTVATTIGLVVATSIGGYVAGSRITSPAEVASRTAPPEPSPILVPVEARVLSTDVVTRGTGRFGSPQKLSAAASALKQNPGLVAELPLPGAELVEGDVIASASGRPLFVLEGVRPMSRDLGPGLSGDDVRQLEAALDRLGYDVGEIDGMYDGQTESGVGAWYAAHGYAPFTATTDQLAAIRTREAELAAASVDALAAADTEAAAEGTLAAARAATVLAADRGERAARGVERARAEAAAADAVAAAEVIARQLIVDRLRAGTPVPRGTAAEVRQARADLAAAQAHAAAVQAAGAFAVSTARSAAERAPAAVAAATTTATANDDAAAAEVAARQAALDAVVADPASTPSQVAAAEADLAAAEAIADVVRIAGAQSVADAQQAALDATATLGNAQAQATADDAAAAADVAARQAALDALLAPIVPTPDEIAAAEADLAAAVASRDVTRLNGERAIDDAAAAAAETAADLAARQAEVATAETALTNARSAVGSRSTVLDLAAQQADLARRRAGVQVPADEIVFVAVTPVRVAELLVGTGDPIAGGVVRVTDALVHVDTGLALGDARLVAPGTVVQIEEPDLGIDTVGVVAFVAATPGTNGVDGFHVYAEITVADPPPNLVGASVRLTIPVESTSASVLAVPLSALSLGPDGASRVQHHRTDGTIQLVDVEAGLSADGYVEITSTDGSLRAGDLVVVGFDPAGPAETPALPPTPSVADTTAAGNG